MVSRVTMSEPTRPKGSTEPVVQGGGLSSSSSSSSLPVVQRRRGTGSSSLPRGTVVGVVVVILCMIGLLWCVSIMSVVWAETPTIRRFVDDSLPQEQAPVLLQQQQQQQQQLVQQQAQPEQQQAQGGEDVEDGEKEAVVMEMESSWVVKVRGRRRRRQRRLDHCSVLQMALSNVMGLNCEHALPSPLPSLVPSRWSTLSPSRVPSGSPSVEGSQPPTQWHTYPPSATSVPSVRPTDGPSSVPSGVPSCHPTPEPTEHPSVIPTVAPSTTVRPSDVPSTTPTTTPTNVPSFVPTQSSSSVPSDRPSDVSSVLPTAVPSPIPTDGPSLSMVPSRPPTDRPTTLPSVPPSSVPTESPTTIPSVRPSLTPTDLPSSVPTHYALNECIFSDRDSVCVDHIDSNMTVRDRKLSVDEYLCSPNRRYRFGLTRNDQQLCLCDGTLKIWCAQDCCDSLKSSPEVELKKNGCLVVYQDRLVGSKTLWRSEPYSEDEDDNDDNDDNNHDEATDKTTDNDQGADVNKNTEGEPYVEPINHRRRNCVALKVTNDGDLGTYEYPSKKEIAAVAEAGVDVDVDVNVNVDPTTNGGGRIFWQADVDSWKLYVRPSPQPTTTSRPSRRPSSPPSVAPTAPPSTVPSPRPTSTHPSTSPSRSHAPSATQAPSSFLPTPSTPRPTGLLAYFGGTPPTGPNTGPTLVDHPSLGLRLAPGLVGRQIARAGDRLSETLVVHDRPDAAGCFDALDVDGTHGWTYVSNSCVANGGMGIFSFDHRGVPTDYRRIERKAGRHCGGSVTPWGSFLTSVEEKNGLYEYDPTTTTATTTTTTATTTTAATKERYTTPPQLTRFGKGNFGAAACDDRNYIQLACFATVVGGPLRRYEPTMTTLLEGIATGNFTHRLLHADSGVGTFLLLDGSGRFSWTGDLSKASQNALQHYPGSTGISHHGGILTLASRGGGGGSGTGTGSGGSGRLTILDLDAGTYVHQSTTAWLDGVPATLVDLGVDGSYLAEGDGSTTPGIYFQRADNDDNDDDDQYQYVPIVQRIPQSFWSIDTASGLAFCDRHRRMMVSFRIAGVIYEITRTDGRSFHPNHMAYAKHHRNKMGGRDSWPWQSIHDNGI